MTANHRRRDPRSAAVEPFLVGLPRHAAQRGRDGHGGPRGGRRADAGCPRRLRRAPACAAPATEPRRPKELQSINEELETVNAELDSKVDERRLFKVIHSDLGRPLTDISQRFDHRSIESDLREETTDGVAITFVDIGELVRLREEVEALRRQLAAAPEAGRGGAISRRDRPSGPER